MGKQKAGRRSAKPRGVAASLLQHVEREGIKGGPKGKAAGEKDFGVTPVDCGWLVCCSWSVKRLSLWGHLRDGWEGPPAMMGSFLAPGMRAAL